MNDKANIQHNKLMKTDDTMLSHGVYNAETIEKLIKNVHKIHSTTLSHERLFAGTLRVLYAHSFGLHHFPIISVLYLRIIQDK